MGSMLRSREEIVAGTLVRNLQDGGDWRPLFDLLGDAPGDPEAVRETLLLLGEFDVRLLAQVCVEAVVLCRGYEASSFGHGGFPRPGRDPRVQRSVA